MFRPGCDENNVQLTDVLCDFCGQAWREDLPVVEGHRGAVICGDCLSHAYRALILNKSGTAGEAMCVLCRETRKEPMWAGRFPGAEGLAHVCTRCTRQSAAVLAKDKDYGWKKPEEGTG